MNKRKFYGLDASDIEMLIRARDYLMSLSDTMEHKIEDLELIPEPEQQMHSNELQALERAYRHIDYAIDYVERTMRDLRHD